MVARRKSAIYSSLIATNSGQCPNMWRLSRGVTPQTFSALKQLDLIKALVIKISAAEKHFHTVLNDDGSSLLNKYVFNS